MVEGSTREITLIREYTAPVKAVWDAFVDAGRAAAWWGPRGFTLTTHSKDLRPGGLWHYTMHGPDGTDFVNKTRYLEVEAQARLVYDHGGNDEQRPMFRVTVRFSPTVEGTRMDMTMLFPTPEAAKATRGFIKKAGGDATWDRLAEYLEKERLGKEIFIFNRSFPASVSEVFDAWVDPKSLARWIAPAGFSMEFLRADIRPGGGSFYALTDGKGPTIHGRAEYLVIDRPTRMVYTQQFCDGQGRVVRHPLSATWPETLRTEIHFTAEGPKQTRITLRWEPHGTVDGVEWATFVNARAGMTQGWTDSFDRLEAYLSRTDGGDGGST